MLVVKNKHYPNLLLCNLSSSVAEPAGYNGAPRNSVTPYGHLQYGNASINDHWQPASKWEWFKQAIPWYLRQLVWYFDYRNDKNLGLAGRERTENVTFEDANYPFKRLMLMFGVRL